MIEMGARPPSRRAAIFELALFLALVFSYIWIWAHAFPGDKMVIYVAGLGLTLLTHAVHREGPAQIGVRLDNFFAAARDAAIPTLPLVAVFVTMGIRGGHFGSEALDLQRFLRVLAWGFLQQYLLQGFIHRRLASAISRPRVRELVVAAIFSLLHVPNPVLMPVTFLAGWVFAVLYRRHPNLIVLALCHAVGSTAVAFGFDTGVLHRMRVGPGYFRF
jgi:membrane protease YdiL (CAAX protease family)